MGGVALAQSNLCLSRAQCTMGCFLLASACNLVHATYVLNDSNSTIRVLIEMAGVLCDKEYHQMLHYKVKFYTLLLT